MPSVRQPRPRRRAWPLALLLALAGLIAVPAGAAPADWAGSKIESPVLTDDDPADQIPPKVTVTTERFPISGLFQRSLGGNPAAEWQITGVSARYNRVAKDAEVGDETPRDEADTCLPLNPGPVQRTSDSPTRAGGKSVYRFTIPETQSTWPCNGRYRVTLTATANRPTGESETHPLRADITVAVRPKPITSVVAELDDVEDEITIDFEKLAPTDTARDALPYRVQRAGPAEDGAYGLFATIGEIPLEAEPTLVDTVDEPGDYRYRVLSVRNGANGPIFALADTTAISDITVEPDPAEPTTTTTTEPTTTTTTEAGPRIGSARPLPTLPNRPAPLPAPPTSGDPGFDPELDYDGAAPLPSNPDEGPELAGEEGLSVIQTEDDGVGAGLVAPVAGGLVLMAWAGHGVYLNRLAKQF